MRNSSISLQESSALSEAEALLRIAILSRSYIIVKVSYRCKQRYANFGLEPSHANFSGVITGSALLNTEILAKCKKNRQRKKLSNLKSAPSYMSLENISEMKDTVVSHSKILN